MSALDLTRSYLANILRHADPLQRDRLRSAVLAAWDKNTHRDISAVIFDTLMDDLGLALRFPNGPPS